MTTRAQRERLIDDADVDSKFDAAAIARLAQLARLLLVVDLAAFGQSVRNAVRNYLEYAHRPHPGEIREEMKLLRNQARRALKGSEVDLIATMQTLTNLPQMAREHLYKPHHPLPEPADLIDPKQRTEVLRLLIGRTVTHAEWKQGRKRSNGKRSRPTLTEFPAGPPVSAGRPSNSAEVMLCHALGILYERATGRKVALNPKHKKSPGPFVRLLAEVLSLCGAPQVDAVELVRKTDESGLWPRY